MSNKSKIELSLEEKFEKIQKGYKVIDAALIRRNRENTSLSIKISEQEEKIEELQNLICEKDEKIEELRSTIQNIMNGGECDCSDWISIGTDPQTWDKLKKCNDCQKISVR